MAIGRNLAAGATIILAFAGAASAQRVLTEQEAAGGQIRVEDQGTVIKPQTQIHLDNAEKAAGTDFLSALGNCNQARPLALRKKLPSSGEIRGAGPTSADLQRAGKTLEEFRASGGAVHPAPAPTKIFDNLYYLGIEDATAWAVDTPKGIIIIDALNNRKEWIDRIEPGMRRIGLDPARIKYVIVSHGHGDHFGGADYLKQKYKARIYMSDLDWKLSPSMVDKPWFDPPPARDLTIKDGQKISLGGTTITIYLTPGHTRGTVSMLIPVTDHGRPHMAALWGGTGFNFPHVPERFAEYANSAQRFARYALAAGADIPLSPHAENDLAIRKIELMQQQKNSGQGLDKPNPFVMGTDAVQRFLTTFGQCALAYRSQVLN